MNWWIWLLALLASARTWRLLYKDDITFWLRDQVSRSTKLWEFYSCPWCFGFWITVGWVGSALAWGTTWPWLLLAGSLAANYVQANLNVHLGDKQ